MVVVVVVVVVKGNVFDEWEFNCGSEVFGFCGKPDSFVYFLVRFQIMTVMKVSSLLKAMLLW